MNQSEMEPNTCKQRQAWENVCEQNTIGFWIYLWEVEKLARHFLTNHNVGKQNESKCKVLSA